MVDRFNDTQMLQLTEIYRDYECLWNVNNSFYKSRDARNAAYMEILKRLDVPGLTVRDIPRKIKNLRTSYYQELKKIEKSSRSGDGTRLYKPKVSWFTTADEYLKAFIKNKDSYLIVKKRPYLWNVNHSSYGERELKLQAWEEIAEILNALCSSGSYADLYTPTNVAEMQRKWKHLRDYYQREKKRGLKAPDNTIASSRKRRSPLLDMLQFLDTNREIEAAVQVYTENNSEEQNNFKETNEEETSNLSETDNSRLNLTQNNKTNSFSGSDENEDDTDKQFLMALLPLIKNMSSREKGNFLKRLLNSMPAEDDTAPLSNEVEQSQSVETRKRKPRDKEKIDDSCNILKSNDVRPSKDDYAIYGQYVANKLRNIRNACARNTAEFKINEILYKAEMGEYDVVSKRRRASSPTSIASSSVKDNPLKINSRYSQDMSSDDEVISNQVYIVKDEVGE